MNPQTNSNLQVIRDTEPALIPEIPFVKDKFVANYNYCHKDKNGELMYHKQIIHFKQAVAGNEQLRNCDRLTIYACFLTIAVKGYSCDPQDDEIYLVPIQGKAKLWPQAGAHVRRLMSTGQIKYAEQARVVYEGDDFHVEGGRVTRHVENFKSENIVGGYVRFIIDAKGTDRFLIYRKSDFEAWRKKSPNPKTVEKQGKNGNYLSESLWDNGIINGTNPEPGFLRTKIVKHACKEKCWATGSTPPQVEQFNVEVDADSKDELKAIQNNEQVTDVEHTDVTNENNLETVAGSFAPADKKDQSATIVHSGGSEDDNAY